MAEERKKEIREILLGISELFAKLANCMRVEEDNVPEMVQPELLFTEEKKPEITLEQVRGVLAGKSRDGFTEEVRKLIVGFGAQRLSEIKPKDYEAVLKAAEEIGHAG